MASQWLGASFAIPAIVNELLMPKTHQCAAASRSSVSLGPSANHAPGANMRCDECFRGFQAWITNESNFPRHLLRWALIGFGKFFFYEGMPKHQLAETINATIDRFPHTVD